MTRWYVEVVVALDVEAANRLAAYRKAKERAAAAGLDPDEVQVRVKEYVLDTTAEATAEVVEAKAWARREPHAAQWVEAACRALGPTDHDALLVHARRLSMEGGG